jgi:hypothetical protein
MQHPLTKRANPKAGSFSNGKTLESVAIGQHLNRVFQVILEVLQEGRA